MRHYNDVQDEDQQAVARVFGASFFSDSSPNPLTSRGRFADTGGESQSSRQDTHAQAGEIDSPPIGFHHQGNLSPACGLPRSETGKGQGQDEKWRTGDSNPLPPLERLDDREAIRLLTEWTAMLRALIDRR